MSRPLRLAINGDGRIGRCVLRALYESPLKEFYQVVAINEPADLASMVYLSQFDSTHGVFPGKVGQGPDSLVVNGHSIRVSHETEPEAVDWQALRSEEHTSELQSLMRISYAVFCLKKKKRNN